METWKNRRPNRKKQKEMRSTNQIRTTWIDRIGWEIVRCATLEKPRRKTWHFGMDIIALDILIVVLPSVKLHETHNEKIPELKNWIVNSRGLLVGFPLSINDSFAHQKLRISQKREESIRIHDIPGNVSKRNDEANSDSFSVRIIWSGRTRGWYMTGQRYSVAFSNQGKPDSASTELWLLFDDQQSMVICCEAIDVPTTEHEHSD
jgi:hypothetical protein